MFKCSVCDSTSNYPYIGLGGCTLCCQCVTDVRIQMMEDKSGYHNVPKIVYKLREKFLLKSVGG
ncbi:MAG: hypothetical protein ACTSVB_11410 [Candidatus Heimdallarchaeaceae archaeon]